MTQHDYELYAPQFRLIISAYWFYLLDVDECTSMRDECDRRSTDCVNLPGGYECTCKAGFDVFTTHKCKGRCCLEVLDESITLPSFEIKKCWP